MRTYNFIGVLLFCLFAFTSHAQEISISKELNLRNYYAYDILGEVDDRIVVYRDKGFVKEIDVFNEEMENTISTELLFEKKRVDVFNIISLDSVFQVLYGYFDNDSMYIRYRIYDRRIQLRDSLTLAAIPKKSIRKKFTNVISEDKNKILLSTVDENENIIFLLYDSRKRALEWITNFIVQEDIARSLSSIELANSGDFLLILNSKAWFKNDEELRMILFKPSDNTQRFISVENNELVKGSLFLKHDNKNNNFVLSGTYGEKQKKEIKGFFYLCKPLNSLKENEKLSYVPFESSFYEELLQGKKKKRRVLNDLTIQDVILRNDGGIIFVSEIEREYSRRNPYNTYSRGSDGYSRRGWVDYYNDDIVVTNFNPDGKIEWNKVLYKKQFSQDDDGIFSSFFIMKTPSRLRFIFNDEIKKNNTVSEYLMNPKGKIARNSLLSTAYQNMKLRFKDAVQISSNSIIVPSERNYDLNLVKITY
ncbi:MAG: hypothetical protein HKO66_05500 [Saprospiraceae bacterium]|nr:hypothetical protein [Bacteroidia bacterium]NNE14215.1 hypothetical protein [Saprospiraceae bacterium]NNL91664.1 hypothetical protein [Saprospiraceae bacterium]